VIFYLKCAAYKSTYLLTYAGIVSKGMHISVKLFLQIMAFSRGLRQLQNSKGNSMSGGVKYDATVGKFANFDRNSPFISETVRDRPMHGYY